MDSETIRFIREEIRRQMNIIVTGGAGFTDDGKSETVDGMFSGMPTAGPFPVTQPYGFNSRAPQETTAVVARAGEHFGNRTVLGHRDDDRPVDIEEGESVQYSKGKKAIYVKNDKILVGSGKADEPMVLGNVNIKFQTELFKQLDMLLQKLQTGPIGVTTIPGQPVPPHPTLVTLALQVQTALDMAKSTYLDTPSTNIISQETFTERGGS